MFGEIILVSGVTLLSALIEKVLESIKKEKQAAFLGLATKTSLAIYAIKQINAVFKEITKDFL